MSDQDLLIWRREHNRNSSAVMLLSDGAVVSSSYFMHDISIPQGSLYVGKGGKVNRLTINALGSSYVTSGGIASHTLINSGGSMEVLNDGIAKFTEVSSGGTVSAASAGAVIRTDISSGATLILGQSALNSDTSVYSGAIVNGFVIKENSSLSDGEFSAIKLSAISGVLFRGQYSLSCNVAPLGSLTVSDGGKAESTTILSSGNMDILEGGTANVINIQSSGTLAVSGPAHVTSVIIDNAGAIVETAQGATITVVDVRSNCVFNANSGALIISAVAREGGVVNVGSGASTSDIIAKSGGVVNILESGQADKLTVSSQGLASIGDNANIVNMFVSSAGTATVLGRGTGCVVKDGGRLTVSSGGSLFSAVISNGGTMNLLEHGSITSAIISMQGQLSVDSGGTATSIFISNGGLLDLGYRASAYDININSNGSMFVRDEAEAMSIHMDTEGLLAVSSGGIVHSTYISAGGTGLVLSSGKLCDATVVSSGIVSVEANGVLRNVTVDSGGYVKLEGSNNAGPNAAVISVLSGGSLFIGLSALVAGIEVSSGGLVNSGFTPVNTVQVMPESFSLSGFKLVSDLDGYVISGQCADGLDFTKTGSSANLHLAGGSLSAVSACIPGYGEKFYIYSGGVMQDVHIVNGNYQHGELIVSSGGTISNVAANFITLGNGGYGENIVAGSRIGYVRAINVSSGGTLAFINPVSLYGNSEYSATIESGGTLANASIATSGISVRLDIDGATVASVVCSNSGCYCSMNAYNSGVIDTFIGDAFSISGNATATHVTVGGSKKGCALNISSAHITDLALYPSSGTELRRTTIYQGAVINTAYVGNAYADDIANTGLCIANSAIVSKFIAAAGAHLISFGGSVGECVLHTGTLTAYSSCSIDSVLLSAGNLQIYGGAAVKNITINPGCSINGFVNHTQESMYMSADSGAVLSGLAVPSNYVGTVFCCQTATNISPQGKAKIVVSSGGTLTDTILSATVEAGAIYGPSVVASQFATIKNITINKACSAIFNLENTTFSNLSVKSGGSLNDLLYQGADDMLIENNAHVVISSAIGAGGDLYSGHTICACDHVNSLTLNSGAVAYNMKLYAPCTINSGAHASAVQLYIGNNQAYINEGCSVVNLSVSVTNRGTLHISSGGTVTGLKLEGSYDGARVSIYSGAICNSVSCNVGYRNLCIDNTMQYAELQDKQVTIVGQAGYIQDVLQVGGSVSCFGAIGTLSQNIGVLSMLGGAHISSANIADRVAVCYPVNIGTVTVLSGAYLNYLYNGTGDAINITGTPESGIIVSGLSCITTFKEAGFIDAKQTAISCYVNSGCVLNVSSGGVVIGAILYNSGSIRGDGCVKSTNISADCTVSCSSAVSCSVMSDGKIYLHDLGAAEDVTLMSGCTVNNNFIYELQESTQLSKSHVLSGFSVSGTAYITSGITACALCGEYLHDCEISVYAGGALVSSYIKPVDAHIRISSGGTISDVTISGGATENGYVSFYRYSSNYAMLGYNLSILNGGVVEAATSSGINEASPSLKLSKITVASGGKLRIVYCTLLKNCSILSSGTVTVSSCYSRYSGAVLSGIKVAESAGHLYLGEYNTANYVSVVSGATMTIASGAKVWNLTADEGAVIISNNGAYIDGVQV